MSAKGVNIGDWYMAKRGRVAHRLARFSHGLAIPLCNDLFHDERDLRPATPEDRRCKRCEERSNG